MPENEKEIEVIDTTDTANKGKGKSIASMVLGIVSLPAMCVQTWIATICAIIGLILGIVGKKTEEAQGMAKAGITLSIITLVIEAIFVIIAVLLLLGSMGILVFDAASSI